MSNPHADEGGVDPSHDCVSVVCRRRGDLAVRTGTRADRRNPSTVALSGEAGLCVTNAAFLMVSAPLQRIAELRAYRHCWTQDFQVVPKSAGLRQNVLPGTA